MKSVNPELSQRLDEIVTDKLNALTSSPDTIQNEEEETQINKDDDHKGKKLYCVLALQLACSSCMLFSIL